jgi:electron-transferring-flavoprotein dehydrogenase
LAGREQCWIYLRAEEESIAFLSLPFQVLRTIHSLTKNFCIGAHTLSGAVLEPTALNELIPDWKEKGAPLNQPALKDKMYFFTKNMAIPLPHPPQMSNKGNYIVSLSNFVKWLGDQAEEAGVELYPSFAASEVV